MNSQELAVTQAAEEASTVSEPRTILVRAGVGAAGRVIQRSDLTSRRLTMEQSTLILVEEGRKRIRWPGGECTASEGDALAVRAGAVVDISNTPGRRGSYRALWLSWSAETVSAQPTTVSALTPGAPVTRHAALEGAFRDSFHAAFDGLRETSALPSAIATHRLHEVLLWLAERGFRFPQVTPPSLGLRLRGLLAEAPDADWSMETVARRTASSVATLRRRLAAEGTSFRDLLQDVRMSYALALLQNTDTPVLDVAFAVGYDSASRFSARFRSRFGYSPSDIRRRAPPHPATPASIHREPRRTRR
ncbi:helix-turn-helix transcriptional regulator [Pyxidicoccus parkwayensis]|uniref:Helix-turn-helix transcriptional regulator n=1 Tax=Pyxidicoccus parkwayensis TaxID=2813578 RepID=A0ABX7NVD7_9BACT|nr:helix-turn-helix transcriptional regulator [Pyxidicoccus parkwaysis]QSQ21361.1 helix-turn-helix transcriptional regulator [Pyxidicoccus parkwaysis]